MADLSSQLSAILSDPEAQKNIQNLLSSLGGGENSSAESPPFDFSSVFRQEPSSAENKNPFSGTDINMIMKLQEIFSKMSCDDRNINLLMALRPHLKNPGKIDSAINILRLISVLPALEESGFFGGGIL